MPRRSAIAAPRISADRAAVVCAVCAAICRDAEQQTRATQALSVLVHTSSLVSDRRTRRSGALLISSSFRRGIAPGAHPRPDESPRVPRSTSLSRAVSATHARRSGDISRRAAAPCQSRVFTVLLCETLLRGRDGVRVLRQPLAPARRASRRPSARPPPASRWRRPAGRAARRASADRHRR